MSIDGKECWLGYWNRRYIQWNASKVSRSHQPADVVYKKEVGLRCKRILIPVSHLIFRRKYISLEWKYRKNSFTIRIYAVVPHKILIFIIHICIWVIMEIFLFVVASYIFARAQYIVHVPKIHICVAYSYRVRVPPCYVSQSFLEC